MNAWLLSIVGITVVGVILELLLTDSPMSKFVRGIFVFFVLWVIIQPIPGFLTGLVRNIGGGDSMVNQELVTQMEANRRQALVPILVQRLERENFNDVIVVVVGGRVFVNAHNSTRTDKDAIISIVTAVMGVTADQVEVFQ